MTGGEGKAVAFCRRGAPCTTAACGTETISFCDIRCVPCKTLRIAGSCTCGGPEILPVSSDSASKDLGY